MCIICQGVAVGASIIASLVPGVSSSQQERLEVPTIAHEVAVVAPEITGKSCRKAGVVRSAGEVSYRCAPSKGGLRWRLQPIATVVTTTTVTTTTTSTTTTTTTTVPTLRSRVYADVVRRAVESWAKPSAAAFEIRISPSISTSRAKQLREAILWAFLPWESQTNGAGPRVVIVDENGEDFWRANMPAGGGNCPGAPGAPAHRPPSRSSYTGFGCWNEDGDRVLYMGIGTDVKEWPSWFLYHEVAHLAQSAIYKSLPRNTEEVCFLDEGEATFYQYVLSDGVKGGEAGHQQGVSTARTIAKKYSLNSDEDWQNFLVGRERRDSVCGQDTFNYHVGILYMEKLYGDFGVEKIASWKSRLPGRSWRDPFREVFGITPTEWYRTSLVPYIRSSCNC
jgi:hypothetical protein